ncbi:MAG: hypothetical protein A2666_00555 [Parcubacteria group bacterium RIFCSPHIGHO2_01_FULL_47_10b]|nr:MAG: hypothetical protein A2666_00555 [Parcubacteria group bacterium RIFCSPHIGHO2_01_FULL_47_10b]
MKQIPHSQPSIGTPEWKILRDPIERRYIAAGSLTETFERLLAEHIGVKHIFVVDSGTSALHLALLALGVKQGDEVIIPSYICSSVLDAVNYTGAQAVIADINETSYNMTVATIQPCVSKKTKAIIVPHLFGLAAPIDKIKAAFPKISIIEDCAQAIGGALHAHSNKKLGSMGDISIFSFYATKVITTGKGGAVATNNNTYAKTIRDLRSNDLISKYRVRYNYSFTDLQAAMGLQQLKKLPQFLKKRRALAQMYLHGLRSANLVLPPQDGHIYYRFVVQFPKNVSVEKITAIATHMKQSGIEVSQTPVWKPIHQLLRLPKRQYPHTETIYDHVLSLPIYPSLSKNDIRHIIQIFLTIYPTRT